MSVMEGDEGMDRQNIKNWRRGRTNFERQRIHL